MTAPHSPDGALRGWRSLPAPPGCHYSSSSNAQSPHTNTSAHAHTHSLYYQARASVTVWWAPGKQLGRYIQAAPAGLTENLDLVLTYSVFEGANMGAEGRLPQTRAECSMEQT